MKLADLFEAWGNGGWAILPATMALYNRRTVDLITAASEWDGSTILICKNSEGRTCFVSSAGGYDEYAKDVGKTFETYHDQTGKSKGAYTIINVVEIKGKEIVKQVNDKELKAKASLSVFK